MSFGFLCPLTIVSKRWRNLRIECLSSRGVIDLGGELYVKMKKVFDVSNLGGELVWYALISINFFVLCIFWFCNHLHTSCVVSIFDDDVCVSLFISHVLFLFHMVPWCILFSTFQERKVKVKSKFCALKWEIVTTEQVQLGIKVMVQL